MSAVEETADGEKFFAWGADLACAASQGLFRFSGAKAHAA